MLVQLPAGMPYDPKPSISDDPPIIELARSEGPSPNIEFHIFAMTSMARIKDAMSPGVIVAEGRPV
ncbi:MAG: hypothetical protein LJE91_17525 [Gammaproteobacteria bacterium]|nr:hypothetical protein [Gammaproteobacteria bacterium]